MVGRDSSVDIATRYGLDGPGIESRWGRDFRHLSRPALKFTQPPIQWVSRLSGGKGAREWLLPPTPSSAEVKERVELYLYFPSGPSCPILGWILPSPLPYPMCVHAGPGSSVRITTDYRLDGPGSNTGGGEIFRLSRPALEPTQPPVKWVPVLSRG